MFSPKFKIIFSSSILVILAMMTQIPTAQAEQLLVCKATENAFDALDNNCDGDVDDIDELDNIGIITGADWYKYSSTGGNPDTLCRSNAGVYQCYSLQDTGSCLTDAAGGYYCDVNFGSQGSTSSTSSDSSGTETNNDNDNQNTNNPAPAVTRTSTPNTPSNNNTPGSTGSSICTVFAGIEKCLTDVDNGNSCEDAGNGYFYCAADSQQEQQANSNICSATTEVYNGIDDDCDGDIDEGVEVISVSNTASAPVPVSAPATIFIFMLGMMALLYTRRKS